MPFALYAPDASSYLCRCTTQQRSVPVRQHPPTMSCTLLPFSLAFGSFYECLERALRTHPRSSLALALTARVAVLVLGIIFVSLPSTDAHGAPPARSFPAVFPRSESGRCGTPEGGALRISVLLRGRHLSVPRCSSSAHYGLSGTQTTRRFPLPWQLAFADDRV